MTEINSSLDKELQAQQQLDEQLYKAVVNGDTKRAQLLIKKGADAKWCYRPKTITPASLSESLLSIAVTLNNPKLVKVLVENGADVNFKIENIQTDITPADDPDAIPLTLTRYETVIQKAVKNGHLKCLSVLLDGAKNPQVCALDGSDCLQSLRKCYPVPENITDGIHSSPLYDAVKSNSLNAAAMLLSKGADVNEGVIEEDDFMAGSFMNHRLPLIAALENRNYEMTNLLLYFGAAKSITYEMRRDLISYTAKLTDKRFEALFLQTPEDLNQAFQLVQFRNPQWTIGLINEAHKHGYPVDIGKPQEGCFLGLNSVPVAFAHSSPLARAINSEKYDIANLMIKKGTGLNIDDITFLIDTEAYDAFNKVTKGNSAVFKTYGAKLLTHCESKISHKIRYNESPAEALAFYKKVKSTVHYATQKSRAKQVQKALKSHTRAD